MTWQRNEFFTAEEWDRLPDGFRGRWAQPASWETLVSEPETPALREGFFRMFLPWLKPEWLPEDIDTRLMYLKVAEGLESLSRSYFFLHYRIDRDEFQVRGKWGGIQMLINPGNVALLEPVRVLIEEGEIPGGKEAESGLKELDPWIVSVWNRYLNPPLRAEAPAQGAITVFPNRVDGGIQLAATVKDFPQEGTYREVMFWSNGRIMEWRLSLPEGSFSGDHPFLIAFMPHPMIPAVEPLNPDRVLYEDTRIFVRPGQGWVNDPERAEETQLRLIYRHNTTATKREYWVRVPVSPETWHLCEYDALVQPIISEVQDHLLYGYHQYPGEEDLKQPQARRTVLAAFESSHERYLKLLNDFRALRYPPQVLAVHQELQAVLERGQKAWEIAREHWEGLVQQNPRFDVQEHAEASRALRKRLEREELLGADLRNRLQQAWQRFQQNTPLRREGG